MNKDKIREITYIKENIKIGEVALQIIFLLIMVALSGWFTYGIFVADEQFGIRNVDTLWELVQIVLASIILFLPWGIILWAGILIAILTDMTEKVVISANGIKYTNIFKKVKSDWENILKIEVITYKVKSEKERESWIDYNISTSRGTFSLKSRSYGGFYTLKEIFNIIRSYAPNISIVEKWVA